MTHPASSQRRLFASAMLGALALPLMARRDSPRDPGVPVDSADISLAARRADLCSASTTYGVGLQGEYFAADAPRGDPFLVRTDGTVDFTTQEWASIGAPHQRPARSARWTGWIRPVTSGGYGFTVRGATARITVGHQPLHGPDAAFDARIAMTPGRFYPVSIEVSHIDDQAPALQLAWRLPYGVELVIPKANLFLPTAGVRA